MSKLSDLVKCSVDYCSFYQTTSFPELSASLKLSLLMNQEYHHMIY